MQQAQQQAAMAQQAQMMQQAMMMQAQQQLQARQQEMIKLLKNERMRSLRIDIETDSTIRSDLTRNMQSMTQFVGGSAQYFQSIAPIVQTGGMSKVAAVKIYSAFARNFKLGKEVDDILDQLADQAEQAEKQQPQPDPKQMEVMARIEIEKARAQREGEKHAGEMQVMAIEQEMKKQEFAMNMADREADRGMKADEMMLKKGDHDLKVSEYDLKSRQADEQNAIAREGMQLKAAGKDVGTKVQVGLGSDDDDMKGFLEAFARMGEMITKAIIQSQENTAKLIAAGNQQVVAAVTAPKTVKTPDGRIYTSQTQTPPRLN